MWAECVEVADELEAEACTDGFSFDWDVFIDKAGWREHLESINASVGEMLAEISKPPQGPRQL